MGVRGKAQVVVATKPNHSVAIELVVVALPRLYRWESTFEAGALGLEKLGAQPFVENVGMLGHGRRMVGV